MIGSVDRIPSETQTLTRVVRGVNLKPGTLADQLGPDPTLLVFLRHFGCVFCRETVADLRRNKKGAPGFPPLLFFQGSPIEDKAFLRRYWPEACAVADPGLAFYQAFRCRPRQLDAGLVCEAPGGVQGPREWPAGR